MATDRDEEIHPGLEMKGGPDALLPYLGQVVAIVDGEVKASGRDWKQALEEADRIGLDDPLFHYVPRYPVIGARHA